MITVEDINSILLKYQYANVFHEIDLSKIDFSKLRNGYSVQYDFCTIYLAKPYYGLLSIEMNNCYCTGLFYLKYENGEILHDVMTYTNVTSGIYKLHFQKVKNNLKINDGKYDLNKITVCLHLSVNAPHNLPEITVGDNDLGKTGFLPLQSTEIAKFGDDFNNKFYIKTLAPEENIINYTINNEPVTLYEDEKGKYLLINTSETGVLGAKTTKSSQGFNFYQFGFKQYRTIPQVTTNNLYLGCNNKIKVYFDGVETDKYDIFYQGKILKDSVLNMIDDLETTDINLTIKINDPNYYNTSVQVNAICQVFTITNEDDLAEAIENQYTTISFAEPFTIENITFDYPLRIINSELTLTNCSFNDDLTLMNCNITLDENDYVFNNLTIENTTISKKSSVEEAFAYIKVLSHLKCVDSSLTSIFTHCGENSMFDNNTFNDSLIFSDNKVTISNSIFNGHPISDYPNMLYLTGEYNVANNNFILSGTFEELTFNMCIIKALKDFDADKFISNNDYEVNISVDGDEYDSFTYCLVDDDTIYTKR